MKYIWLSLLVAALIIASAETAAADSHTVGLYTDETATNCNLIDTKSNCFELHTIYVIYTGPSKLIAVEFQVLQTDGADLTYLGQNYPYEHGGAMGKADTGIGIAIGHCLDSPTLVLTVLYQGLGVSGDCGKVKIGPNPQSRHVNGDQIAWIECGTEQIAWADPSYVTVNPDDDCECHTDPNGGPSPVAMSTWGGIKAMYTD